MRRIVLGILIILSHQVFSAVSVGTKVPDFQLLDQDGKSFSIQSRKDKGWTVLFFYPKAGTPGCTKQVCAFRDSIKAIKELGAETYGISSDSVAVQSKFHQEHKLQFTLLADPELKAINLFGVKMLGIDLAKRWTFIIDPKLILRSIDDKVDPVMDPTHVTQKLKALQTAP